MFISAAKLRTLDALSSAIPTISTPFETCFPCILFNTGISSRQGAHQVAQKFTTSTLLRHFDSAGALSLVAGPVDAHPNRRGFSVHGQHADCPLLISAVVMQLRDLVGNVAVQEKYLQLLAAIGENLQIDV